MDQSLTGFLEHDFLVFSLALSTNWFAMVRVNGFSIKFLIDTGSAITIIDISVWDNMPAKGELLPYEQSYKVANGGWLKALGRCEVQMCIESVCVVKEVVVAQLGAAVGILGYDYFKEYDCVLYAKECMEVLGA